MSGHAFACLVLRIADARAREKSAQRIASYEVSVSVGPLRPESGRSGEVEGFRGSSASPRAVEVTP